jgi:hypothetical protein
VYARQSHRQRAGVPAIYHSVVFEEEEFYLQATKIMCASEKQKLHKEAPSFYGSSPLARLSIELKYCV